MGGKKRSKSQKPSEKETCPKCGGNGLVDISGKWPGKVTKKTREEDIERCPRCW